MKPHKCLFVIIFVFLPVILFSQILEPGDIAIFIDGEESLDETLDVLISGNDDYYKQIEELLSHLFSLVASAAISEEAINNDEFNTLKEKYQNLLKSSAPKELNDTFIRLGWKNNGHKKFITILFGIIITNPQIEELLKTEVLLSLFDKSDLAIIREMQLLLE